MTHITLHLYSRCLFSELWTSARIHRTCLCYNDHHSVGVWLIIQSCPTLCNLIDCSTPGSSVLGILQAWILEWVAKLSSRGTSNLGIEPSSHALQADSLPSEPAGKPKNTEMGSLSLLQRFFLTQESDQSLLHYRRILCQLSYQGSRVSQSNFCIFIPISQESWNNVKGNIWMISQRTSFEKSMTEIRKRLLFCLLLHSLRGRSMCCPCGLLTTSTRTWFRYVSSSGRKRV